MIAEFLMEAGAERWSHFNYKSDNYPVGWGCRMHWLLLCREVRPSYNYCPGHDTKQSHGEVPVMLGLWGMRSTPSLPSLPGPLWLGVEAPIGQIELNSVLIQNWIAWNRTVSTINSKQNNILNWIVWNLSKWLNSALNDPKSVDTP